MELTISLPSQNCEDFKYPINDIEIKQNNIKVEISFFKDVNYRSLDNSEWKLYKAESLRHIFNINTNELKSITSDR